MKKEKKVKKKINIKGLIFLILIIYLIFNLFYFIIRRPIKNIIVKGNTYVSTTNIIEKSGINEQSTLFNTSILKTEKNLKENKIIKKVKISKSLFGKITITIEENKPLFINLLEDKLILSDGNGIEYDNTYSVPILINYVPESTYKELISGMNKLDDDIITKISEIEYSPDKSEDIVFDEERFLLRMNDGNKVYINTPNITKLNNYNTIYQEVGSGGTLLLDSASQNYIFKKN